MLFYENKKVCQFLIFKNKIMREVVVRKEFLLANGLSQLPNASMTDDLSPYDYFDGCLDVDIDPEFSEASGVRRRARRRVKRNSRQMPRQRSRQSSTRRSSSQRQGNFERVMAYTPVGMVKNAIDRRNSPEAQRKRQQLDVQQKRAVQNVERQAQSDAQLLAQLSQPNLPTVSPTKSGMSRNTKIGLIAGGVIVASVIGFLVYQKIKKN
jgi:hypothetical protein